MTLMIGDTRDRLKELASNSVQCVVTSPPYWGLRDYGVASQLGLEPTPEEYVANLVQVFSEVRRVLRDDGTLWLNIGDSYGKGGGKQVVQTKNASHGLDGMRQATPGFASKQLIGIPWRVALALQAGGWYLRSDIIWHKPNVMPESVTDRPTKAHEYLFLLSKSDKYYYDAEAVKEPITTAPKTGRYTNRGKEAYQVASGFNGQPQLFSRKADPSGRNRRTVWSINTQPLKDAHFAVFPEALVEPCILAGSKPLDNVLDPFMGSGTVGVVCSRLCRIFYGIELNPEYVAIAQKRIGPLMMDSL